MSRSNKQETELLQRRIWMYRSRGMSLQRIADAVGKSKTTVAYHLQKARTNAYEWYEGVGEQEVTGEMLLNHREVRQEAQRNLARTQPASTSRLRWLQEVRASLRAETDFLFNLGLLRKAPEQLDITMNDVRSMSADEISRTIVRLQKELAYTPVKGINMNRGGDAAFEVDEIDGESGDVIDALPVRRRGDEDDDDDDDDDDSVPVNREQPGQDRLLEMAASEDVEEIPDGVEDDEVPTEDPTSDDGEWEEFDPYGPSGHATAEDGP